MKHIVSRMSSYFPNRWPLSYLNLTKNMKTYIRRQQHKNFIHQDIKQKEPPQKYRLGTISNTKKPEKNTVKPEYPQMTLSQRIGVVEINTLWLFRYLQLAKKHTKVVSFHRLSGTGMASLIHLSLLLKCLMTVCPSSLHSCVQWTNLSPILTPWWNNVIWRVISNLFRFKFR